MGKLFDKLNSDVRFIEGIKACINCGTCTAICPAAEVYNYDPRSIANLVQTRDDSVIEARQYCLKKRPLPLTTLLYFAQSQAGLSRIPQGQKFQALH